MKENLWDQKAKTFVRYDENLSSIQKKSFEFLDDLNISLKDKRLIDIGCGTGAWTLHLAKVAKSILALDGSIKMLEVLENDAKNLNITNIKTLHSTFKDFYINSNQKFEIAFASMSPALAKNEDFEAFLNLAPLKIYIGWQNYRKSDFLSPIFKHFNAKEKNFNGNDIELFLKNNNIDFKRSIFKETRIVEKTRANAISGAKWHLDMANCNVDIKELENIIKDEIIKETIKSKMKILVFK